MLKLTRGAITMLLKEYRSILKNAYIKNMAAGAMLVGSLSLGSNAYATEPANCTVDGKCTIAADEALAVTSDKTYTDVIVEEKGEGSASGKVDITEGVKLTADSILNSGDITVANSGDNVAAIQTSSLTNNGSIETDATDELTITGKLLGHTEGTATQNDLGVWYKIDKDNYGDLAVTVDKDSSITNGGSLTIGALSGSSEPEGNGSAEVSPFSYTETTVGVQTFTAEEDAEINNTGTLTLNADADIAAGVLTNAGSLVINSGAATIRSFENAGSITVGGVAKNVNAILTAKADAEDTAVIKNGKELRVGANATASVNAGGVLSNAGTVTVGRGGTLNTGTVVNAGNIDINSATQMI
ncbi:MAG: hypothetical protein ACI4M9_08825, partial [Succinivibrio sp.]